MDELIAEKLASFDGLMMADYIQPPISQMMLFAEYFANNSPVAQEPVLCRQHYNWLLNWGYWSEHCDNAILRSFHTSSPYEYLKLAGYISSVYLTIKGVI